MSTGAVEKEEAVDEAKIEVTTEMISKYKMKIVTCQEIEFEGKDGENIEELAKEKLLQYQNERGYSQMMLEKQDNCPRMEHLQESKETTAVTEEATETMLEPEVTEVKPAEEAKQLPTTSEDIMAKIMMAKKKASTALNEYAKSKKK